MGVFSQKGKAYLVHNYLSCETQVESSTLSIANGGLDPTVLNFFFIQSSTSLNNLVSFKVSHIWRWAQCRKRSNGLLNEMRGRGSEREAAHSEQQRISELRLTVLKQRVAKTSRRRSVTINDK